MDDSFVASMVKLSLAGLQVWQALTERVSGRPANPEVTIVFTDLVGFSKWSLSVGDEITLRLLRRVAQVFEPPLLESGGHIVKRMGVPEEAARTAVANARAMYEKDAPRREPEKVATLKGEVDKARRASAKLADNGNHSNRGQDAR